MSWFPYQQDYYTGRVADICEVTGLEYCGPDCLCHDEPEEEPTPRMVFPYPGGRDVESWVPTWMDGATPESVGTWLVEQGKLAAADAAKGGERCRN